MSESFKQVINESILTRSITQMSLLEIAIAVHRNHKNEKLIFPVNSFLEDIYKDRNRQMVIKKSTQCGVSEYLIIKTLKSAMDGKNVLYVLPTFLLKNQFVAERINKSLLFTKVYQELMSDNKGLADSMTIKQFNGSIIFTGSNTPSAFISYPADDVVIDELDECASEYLPMAEERQSASKNKSTTKVGNPTIPNYGIDYEYENSDKKVWLIKCACGEEFTPDFFQNVVMQVEKDLWLVRDKSFRANGVDDIKPICHKCGKPFNRFSSGRWVAQKQSDVSGYQISKMFSTTVTLKEILKRFRDGLMNETIMQRFYNGDLGQAFTSSGASITEEMLDACVKEYSMPDSTEKLCVAGVDVGTNLNIVIAEVLQDGLLKVVNVTESPMEYDDVANLFRQYNVKCFVVDSAPETRFSLKLVNNFFGFTCNVNASNTEMNINPARKSVSVIRTAFLDATKENILTKSILFPQNAKSIPNFYKQMTSSVRVYDDKKEKFDWVHGNTPDHYFFSMSYMILARRLLLQIAR